MAKTQNEIQRRMKILEKLISLGINTEEQIKSLSPKDLTKDESITFADIMLFCEMQESVKNNRMFSFIAKGGAL